MSLATERARIALPPERAELGVHALAQLPDDVRLCVSTSLDPTGPVLMAARAYGVEDRIDVMLDGGAEYEQAETLAMLVEGRGGRDPATYADGVLSGQRLAVVTNVPTHYRVALFNKVARRVEEEGATIRVFFLARTPSTRTWMDPGEIRFEHEFLRGIDLSRDRGRRVFPLDLERRLAAFAPTTVLVGGFSPLVAGRAAVYSRRKGVPFGVWSGELASRPTARQRLRRHQRVRLLRRATYAVAYGSRAAVYLRTLRDCLPVVIGRNSTIVPDSEPARLPRSTVELLTVARAEPGKALDVLVDAVRRSPDLPCRLAVVGDGPALPALRLRASGDGRIQFRGALEPSEIRRMLPTADVFLFPSRYDVFGLAVVEAMSAGLATVVSSLPGAVDDLCVSESNCLVIDGGPDDWAAAIGRLVGDSKLRARLGAAAAETISSRWTLEHAASAMVAGFRLAFLPSALSDR